MASIETIFAFLFIILLTFLIYIKRKNLDTKHFLNDFFNFSMYKTKWGLKLMDSWAKKHRRFFVILGYVGIVVGFLGMLLMGFELFRNIFDLFTNPDAAVNAGLVAPIKAKGVFFVPFFYWIISIFVLATVHEFAHGLIARAHNIKVKSSGLAFVGSSLKGIGIIAIVISIIVKLRSVNFDFALAFTNYDFALFSADFWLIGGVLLYLFSKYKSMFVPIIPAAFVEPDEKMLVKRPHRQQISVFAAGPFANIITAIFCVLILLSLTPIANSMNESNGVAITDYVKKEGVLYPAEANSITIGEIIKGIDGVQILTIDDLSQTLKTKSPNQVINLITNNNTYILELGVNPEDETLPYIGAYLAEEKILKESVTEKYGTAIPSVFEWIYGLIFMIYFLNLGIGLFNLVPIGPLDGGRMVQLPLQKWLGKETGNKIWGYISLVFLLILLYILATGFGLIDLFGSVLSLIV
jgi:membrane-associated protease RseP (regulator of RpoE activity)